MCNRTYDVTLGGCPLGKPSSTSVVRVQPCAYFSTPRILVALSCSLPSWLKMETMPIECYCCILCLLQPHGTGICGCPLHRCLNRCQPMRWRHFIDLSLPFTLHVFTALPHFVLVPRLPLSSPSSISVWLRICLDFVFSSTGVFLCLSIACGPS